MWKIYYNTLFITICGVSSIQNEMFDFSKTQNFGESIKKMMSLISEASTTVAKSSESVDKENKTAYENLEIKRNQLVKDVKNAESNARLNPTTPTVDFCISKSVDSAGTIIATGVREVIGCFTDNIGKIMKNIGELMNTTSVAQSEVQTAIAASEKCLSNPFTGMMCMGMEKIKFDFKAAVIAARIVVLIAGLSIDIPALPVVLGQCIAERFSGATFSAGQAISEIILCGSGVFSNIFG